MAIGLRLDTIVKDNAPGAKEEAHFAYVQIYDDGTGQILEAVCIPCDSKDIAAFKAAVKSFYDKYKAANTGKDELKSIIATTLSDIEKGV